MRLRAGVVGVGYLGRFHALKYAAHPDVDLVAVVADRIYRDVVGEGYPGVSAAEFERADASVKTYSGSAWLWTGERPAGGER